MAAGIIRSDTTPTDLSAALAGIAFTSGLPEERERAERLLVVVLDGPWATPRSG